jgi:hypothetical protein
MVVCDFDMRFTFVVTDWSGLAHDTRILNNTLLTYAQKFPHPPHGNYLYVCTCMFAIHSIINYYAHINTYNIQENITLSTQDIQIKKVFLRHTMVNDIMCLNSNMVIQSDGKRCLTMHIHLLEM